jgi:hypothetical protein
MKLPSILPVRRHAQGTPVTPDAFIGSVLPDGRAVRLDLTGHPAFTGDQEIDGTWFGLLRLGKAGGGHETFGVSAAYRDELIGALLKMHAREPVPSTATAGGAAS